jgi:hypothetical protein
MQTTTATRPGVSRRSNHHWLQCTLLYLLASAPLAVHAADAREPELTAADTGLAVRRAMLARRQYRDSQAGGDGASDPRCWPLMTAHPTAGAQTWVGRVGWLVVIWMGGVLALAVVAGLFRVVMNLAGLTV